MATTDLEFAPALSRLDLLAAPLVAALQSWSGATLITSFQVAASDPEVADTAAFCERYGFTMEQSVNCVVIAGRRGGDVRYAACMVLATTRADVNGKVRKLIDARKASFAPMDDAVSLTGMEFGGITPFGLPATWPVYVDSRVLDVDFGVVGSGIRASKLFVPGAAIAEIPSAQVIEGLAT
jgi:prolyl-tRNA editing enzyme YbaK/EbsC (Cys-tRNA(Pro) deacylase)